MSFKKILVIILAVGAAVFLLYALFTAEKRSDEQLLAAFVADGVVAVNERSFSKVMDMVSDDFKAPDDINKARFRMLVAQAFRGQSSLSVEATPVSTEITGNTARMKVKVAAVPWSFDAHPIEQEINITLAKETGRRLLFFPTVKWRCTGTDSLVMDHEGF